MNCVSTKCSCSDPNVSYWNGTFCAPVQSYLGDCKTNSTCKPSSFLLCNTTEHFPNKCTCLPFHFWNSANEICQPMKTINETCGSALECYSHTKLVCEILNMGVKRCICEPNHYWSVSSKSCGLSKKFETLNNFKKYSFLEKKATYGEVCTVCDDTLLLSCNIANYCVCDGNRFWNGTFCGIFNFVFNLKKKIIIIKDLDITNGLNCLNNFDCDSAVGLSCDNTYNQCV